MSAHIAFSNMLAPTHDITIRHILVADSTLIMIIKCYSGTDGEVRSLEKFLA